MEWVRSVVAVLDVLLNLFRLESLFCCFSFGFLAVAFGVGAGAGAVSAIVSLTGCGWPFGVVCSGRWDKMPR